MLQALFKGKIERAINNGSILLIEDILTSSVIGVLQYLPDPLFWRVISGACGESFDLPSSIGAIKEFHFWEKLPAKDNTSNSRFVEPDVWVETELYDIIIEAKRADSASVNAQSEYQWHDQIQALHNYRQENDLEAKEILYLALGGNTSMSNQTQSVSDHQHIIHNASWHNLLDSINKCRHSLTQNVDLSSRRILDDACNVLISQGIFHTIWFDSFHCFQIQKAALSTINKAWYPDSSPNLFLSELSHTKQHRINTNNLSVIWSTPRI